MTHVIALREEFRIETTPRTNLVDNFWFITNQLCYDFGIGRVAIQAFPNVKAKFLCNKHSENFLIYRVVSAPSVSKMTLERGQHSSLFLLTSRVNVILKIHFYNLKCIR